MRIEGELPKKYDGFYFMPPNNENEEGFIFHFFNLKNEHENGAPIDNSNMGDMFHVAFFKRDDDGKPQFDDSFEAIFIDPITYVSKTLIGSEIYGCFCRKTDKSEKWFEDYLTRVAKPVTMFKIIDVLKSIAETKS
jgi:hypothetical protein